MPKVEGVREKAGKKYGSRFKKGRRWATLSADAREDFLAGWDAAIAYRESLEAPKKPRKLRQ